MEKKQSSVDWFYEQIRENGAGFTQEDLFEWRKQAKLIEKEQSMDDFMAGKWDWAEHMKGKESKDPAEYYNQVYNNKDNF